MNNFQYITQNIDLLVKFLSENTKYTEEFWRNYLQQERINHENNN